MRKPYTFFTGLTLALASALSGAQEMDNSFLRAGGSYLYKGETRGQSLEFTTAPDGKPATRLGWDFSRFKFAEVNLRKPLQITSFQELELALDYSSSGRRQLDSCGFRIADASGEVFQWSCPAGDDLPGWKTIRCRLTPRNFNSCWGGDGNKTIDFPARLIGFGAGFCRESSGPVWFGALRFRFPEEKKKIPVLEYSWNFDEKAEFWKSWGAGRLEKQTVSADRNGEIFLNERMFAIRPAEECRELRLSCTLQNGNATVAVRVRDGAGKSQLLTALPLVSGRNRLSFPLAGLASPVRIEQLRIDNRGGSLRLELETLELWTEKETAAALSAAVDTGHPLHLLLPGKSRTAVLVLTNRAERPLTLKGKFTLSDYFGECAQFERDIALPAGKSMRIPVDTTPFPRDGIYYVDYRFVNPDENSSEGVSGRISFARMTPAGPTPGRAQGFLFGICTHTERWGIRDRELEVLACALAGAKVIRSSPGWEIVQPKKGAWDYTLYDRMVEQYAASGMELQAGFGLCNQWGKAADAKMRDGSPDRLNNGRSMPDLELWRLYVRNTVSRYRGKIRFWEVWNEPDLTHFANFGVEDYARLLAASAEEIRRADPEARMMNGGFAGLTAPAQVEYQRRFLELARGTFDVHAFHQHGEFGVFRQVIDELFLPQRRETGTAVPWFANETAMHSLGGREQLQAESLFKKLIFARARGAIGYTWYDLRNDGFSVTDAEHNYGMVTNDFYPKAVYPAFAALVNLYRDADFDRELPLGTGEFAFLFRKKGELILGAWREVSADDATGGLYAGTTDGTRVRRVDIMGNSTDVPLENGRFLFQPGRIPESLVVEGGSRLAFHPVLNIATIGPVAEGRPATLEFELPDDSIPMLKCELAAEKPFQIREKKFLLKAVPGSRTKIRKTLTVGSGLGTEMRQLPLRIAIPGGGEAEILIPVYPAWKLSRALSPENPDFVLNRRGQVVSVYDKVPGHSIWEGPEDLSARISCGIEQDELVVRAEVTDDIHRQNDSGSEIWRGDSLQLFFQLPGQKGEWELGNALTSAGGEHWVWRAPEGFTAAAARSAIRSKAGRVGSVTTCEIHIPFKAIGLTPQMLWEGFRFNLLVNDSDVPGDEREGWIRLAPGVGDERNTLRYPVVFFE
ncbi:sugar-binding protein [uncultured Victivallis sp.]|uniref:sugar-binding protein n=1 Tax=uncultured Victivallis sp. TaxID=354118 RepID=UPI0025FC9399|nr:sugar-binding protein [uncultured Victivallis sp.]